MNRPTVRTRWLIGLWGILSFWAIGCSDKQVPSPESVPDEELSTPLQIAAASDLQKALTAVAKQFTSDTLTEVNITFNASGLLADQIQAGAPFDIFFAANITFVEKLAESGHVVRKSIEPYARGKLVLAVRQSSTDAIKTLADLTRPEIKKIALANPKVAPYGAAGKEALEHAGLWDQVAPKIVQAESVRQALQYVASGNAEAGLVSAALGEEPDVKVVDVDAKLYDPIIQGVGVLSRTTQATAAESFVRFVQSDAGQAILAKYGFSRAEPRETTSTPPQEKKAPTEPDPKSR